MSCPYTQKYIARYGGIALDINILNLLNTDCL